MNKANISTPQPVIESAGFVHSIREYAEALGVALVLAFLFKAFIIEAYSIPTGSMASTLMGRHKDVFCEACGFPFQLGASKESNEGSENPKPADYLPQIVAGTCPQCQYTMYVGQTPDGRASRASYSGDRIFVNKSIFNFREPSRWHVTVFRYPARPQINYIKRLVGVENETLLLRNGDVFVRKEGTDEFKIQRKPLRAMLAMLRPVDDNDYVLPSLHKLGWKTRWYGDEQSWNTANDYKSFAGHHSAKDAPADETAWLRFRNIIPSSAEWNNLMQGKLPDNGETGTPLLVTDFVAYNSQWTYEPEFGMPHEIHALDLAGGEKKIVCPKNPAGFGLNWVGDLTLSCLLHVEQASGTAVFRLIKGGIAFQCEIDLASGKASFSIPGVPEFVPFSADTPVKKTGKYRMMFCNIDEEMRLIVNGKETDTAGKGEYDVYCRPGTLLARDRPPTALDLEPAAVGIRNTQVKVEHIKIQRDLYYISCDEMTSRRCDLEKPPFRHDFSYGEESIRKVLSSPDRWQDFGKTQETFFELGKGQFLMLGDNSAESKDSRLWTVDRIPYYVDRKFLIGEAVFVYWPHGFRIPGTRLALIPNPSKMRWID
ncbi:MAG: S26 family signal peptidase [Planctomycetaceae bacterium]|jgi:signal peptidase I|nr:S26 family signal peptidase [Planctomycetaceae bacterium]